MIFFTAEEIFNKLKELNWKNIEGGINFNLAGINVKINTTDTVGVNLQSWLGEYLKINNIYSRTSLNTQEFPDFFLSEKDDEKLLEVKAFHYSKSPAFDIANFESYCDSVKDKPYRLFADYIIFGYEMDDEGKITIENIWLKKIWEIAGSSEKYPLKTQVKRDMIYNIRPNSKFKKGLSSPFGSHNDFIKALYETLVKYKGKTLADIWLVDFKRNYKKYYKIEFEF